MCGKAGGMGDSEEVRNEFTPRSDGGMGICGVAIARMGEIDPTKTARAKMGTVPSESPSAWTVPFFAYPVASGFLLGSRRSGARKRGQTRLRSFLASLVSVPVFAPLHSFSGPQR